MSATNRLRSFGIWLSLEGCKFATSALFFPDLSEGSPITVRNHIGWWLESQCLRLFGLAYEGSQEELDAVWYREIPLR